MADYGMVFVLLVLMAVISVATVDQQQPTGVAAGHDLADTINWNPIPNELGAASERIIGVQGTFWGEFTTRDSQLWQFYRQWWYR